MRLLLATISACISVSSLAATISGPSVVVDGDTLRIGGERIRLLGIDAPERDQVCAALDGSRWSCGATASQMLQVVTQTGATTCEWLERDQYGRILATCVDEMGASVNAAMVRSGMAWSYMSDLYADDEAEARSAGIGIWGAPNQTAADYRRAADVAAQANQPQPPNPACNIKGNINGAGEHIYHLPGNPGYEATIIRVEQGERWFCSELDALTAGWRAPLGD